MVRQPANTLDSRIATLAALQHGVIATSQLRELGLPPNAVVMRAHRGRLVRIHRGVYAVGHAGLSQHGRWMAAVLACGADAALSHRSAAQLWTLLPPTSGVPHVTIPGDSGRAKRPGIQLHRSLTLLPADRTRRLNIPVTTPARTLRDLSRCAPDSVLHAAQRQADFLGLPVSDSMLPAPERTRSELERGFLALCRRGRLEEPDVNVAIGSYVVDFLWRRAALIVETDGYAAHRGRAAFEHDHRRQAELTAAGYEVLRFTWRQVNEVPDSVLVTIRRRLAVAERGATGSSRPA